MADQKITTAAELDEMTPAERDEHFEQSIVWDPSTLSEHAQEQLRLQSARVLARQEERHAS